ncbi:hypothetical protein IJZ97_01880 [bacterium]|nr:hypothetical protein [bacterium]
MPKLLVGAGTVISVGDAIKHRDEKDRFVKNAIITTSIIGTTLFATKKFNLLDVTPTKEIVKKQTKAVQEYIQKTNLRDENLLSILKKSEKDHLSPDAVRVLFDDLKDDSNRAVLFKTLFNEGKNLTSKEIFSEIGRLSVLGAIPVASGIAGGIVADTVTGTSTKKSRANKIKEGFYQYFANIFLCNVGAGAALYGAEKLQQKGVIKALTPMKKLGVILAGITATGIVGGSYIANFLSKKVINPLFGQKKQEKGIYSERKPEALDIALHADDIATAGVLSGVKWIEPMLPVMYFVSGFRAGTGYRNVNK